MRSCWPRRNRGTRGLRGNKEGRNEGRREGGPWGHSIREGRGRRERDDEGRGGVGRGVGRDGGEVGGEGWGWRLGLGPRAPPRRRSIIKIDDEDMHGMTLNKTYQFKHGLKAFAVKNK